MIDIRISDKAYENDVYPLIKAFYPRQSVKTTVMEQEAIEELQTKLVSQKGLEGDHDMLCVVNFTEPAAILSFQFKSGNVVEEKITFSSNRSVLKNNLKRGLYHLLAKETGNQLPWGILTGIRPTKLVYEMMEKNLDQDEIHRFMSEEYLCSDEKINISIDIARRELDLLEALDYKKGYSLYIGIPFCPSTCLYCSFTSYSIQRFAHLVEPYLEALEKEMTYGATALPDRRLTTVYLGGGTPTTLTAEQLDWLLGKIREKFDFSHVKEFCVEAGRPDSITRDKLVALKKWGVDRISINPQSMQQRTLDLIGRQHTVEEIKETFAIAREVGHDNINMDIIIGLTGENPEDVKDTLAEIKKLDPESVTVHTLAIKRAARLNAEKDQYADKEAVDVATMLDETITFAKEQNYLPYYLYRQKNMAENLENVGYSKAGYEGIYNILIMEEKQTILALGAGAMSKFVFHAEGRLERVDNVKNVTDYISRIDEMIERKRAFIQEEYLPKINK